MKFQDDISNMNTYIHTYIRTDKPKPICPPTFSKLGAKKFGGGGGGWEGVGGGGGGRGRGQGGCERRIEVFVKIKKKKYFFGGGGGGGRWEGSGWGGGQGGCERN